MEHSEATKPARKGAGFAFTLLFLLYFFDYADRMVVSSLFPFIKQEWGLSDAQCALLTSVVYWSITASTLPISILADRWSRKHVIGGMALFWSLATAACGLARNFPQLIGARIAIGIGEAGYAPAGTAMISGLFDRKRRSLMMGIWNASIPLGSAAGIILGGFIAVNYGWKHAFGVVALPGMIVSLLFFWVKDYKTVELRAAPEGPKLDFKEIARRFVATPTLVFTFLGFAANTFVVVSLLNWLTTFLHRTHGLPVDKAAFKGSLVMLMAIIGAPLGGFLADRWLRRNPNARPLFASLSTVGTAAVFFVAFSLLKGNLQYAMLLLGGVFAMAYVPAAAAMTQDVVHPGLRAVSYSLCVVVQNLLGSSLGPLFVGTVSDNSDIATAMSMLPAFALLSAVFFFAASRFYLKDLARADKEELALGTS